MVENSYIYLILHAPERKTIAVHLGQTIFKLQGKMTLLLQDKVKYEFKKNEARNKCLTSFSCYFDWTINC